MALLYLDRPFHKPNCLQLYSCTAIYTIRHRVEKRELSAVIISYEMHHMIAVPKSSAQPYGMHGCCGKSAGVNHFSEWNVPSDSVGGTYSYQAIQEDLHGRPSIGHDEDAGAADGAAG